jgi:4-hydroxy-tetrahydrodipicolinate reductase
MKKIRVLIAGLPGAMATLIAKAVTEQTDMTLCPWGLSEAGRWLNSGEDDEMELIPTHRHESFLESYGHNVDLIVDFTQPDAVNCNAEMYCRHKIPFVMGTTGGDRQKLMETMGSSHNCAVIATNMAGPIVAFQEMMHYAAKKFPGLFDGYCLTITESHQASKKDVSGVASGLLEQFAELGMPMEKDRIRAYRDPGLQEMHLHIPKEYLDGHGYHTYKIEAPDDSITLQFKHDVRGRGIYVNGVLKAIRFLTSHKIPGIVYSMADVLRSK